VTNRSPSQGQPAPPVTTRVNVGQGPRPPQFTHRTTCRTPRTEITVFTSRKRTQSFNITAAYQAADSATKCHRSTRDKSCLRRRGRRNILARKSPGTSRRKQIRNRISFHQVQNQIGRTTRTTYTYSSAGYLSSTSSNTSTSSSTGT
jgi:hypothetical protein